MKDVPSNPGRANSGRTCAPPSHLPTDNSKRSLAIASQDRMLIHVNGAMNDVLQCNIPQRCSMRCDAHGNKILGAGKTSSGTIISSHYKWRKTGG